MSKNGDSERAPAWLSLLLAFGLSMAGVIVIVETPSDDYGPSPSAPKPIYEP